MSDIEKRLREAMDGVTPGPWETTGNSVTDFGREWPGSLSMEFIPNGIDEDTNFRHESDARYIALCSPDNIGALLDTIASLRSKLEEAEGALEKCQKVLAMLTDPDSRAETNITSAWAQCVEAELVARRSLAALREADHG